MFRITETFTELSNENYHKHGTEIISSSYLKNIYKHSIKKASIPLVQNEALIFGSQFHDMCQYGDKEFIKKHHVIPEDCSNKRTKAYKEFIKIHPNAITKEDFSKLHTMYYSLQSNIFYSDLETNYKSYAEHSFFAEKDGLKYRIRPDKHYSYNGQIRYLIDFKTCQDVTKFMYDIKTYNYDLQAVFYADVLQINPIDFYFIAIEKNYPYTTQVFGMSDTTIERGRTKMDIAIKRIKDNEQGVGMPLVERV